VCWTVGAEILIPRFTHLDWMSVFAEHAAVWCMFKQYSQKSTTFVNGHLLCCTPMGHF